MRTQRQRVIDYINRFGSITSMQAFADLGITQLAARICELKDEGYEFKKEQVSSVNRFGETVYFKKYSFAESEVEQ